MSSVKAHSNFYKIFIKVDTIPDFSDARTALNHTFCLITICSCSVLVHFRLSPVILDHPVFHPSLYILNDPNPDNRDFYPAHQIFRKLIFSKVAF